MNFQSLSQQYETWRNAVLAAIWPLLLQARTQLVSVQNRADTDERIDRIEQLLLAQVEPILLQREMDLEPLREQVERYFETRESPTPEEEALRDRIGNGLGDIRDMLSRKVNSLVAQARANELLAQAPGSDHAACGAGSPGVRAMRCAVPSAGPPVQALHELRAEFLSTRSCRTDSVTRYSPRSDPAFKASCSAPASSILVNGLVR